MGDASKGPPIGCVDDVIGELRDSITLREATIECLARRIGSDMAHLCAQNPNFDADGPLLRDAFCAGVAEHPHPRADLLALFVRAKLGGSPEDQLAFQQAVVLYMASGGFDHGE
jgi:hypothetical protein